MKSSKKIKMIIICIAYVIAIIVQLSVFTPYTVTETYISSQNVPHTVTIERGWTSFEHADDYVHNNKKGVIARQQVDYNLLVFQFALTTAIAACACYLLCRKKAVVPEISDTTDNSLLRKQNIQLQEAIDEVSRQIDKITLENEALRSQIIKLTQNRAEEGIYKDKKLSLSYAKIEPPYLDVNGLAFADEETVRQAQKQYAEDLYEYFKLMNEIEMQNLKKKYGID